MWARFRGMSAGNMWFDERNLPLTFRIKLVKDYPYAEKKKRRKEKRIYFSMQKLTCLDIYVYIYIYTYTFEEREKHYLLTDVFESMVLLYKGKSRRGRKNWKRVLIVVAFKLRLSRYAFIIIRNGRRRVKSLNAPWLINFLWIFYYLRELSFHLSFTLPLSRLSSFWTSFLLAFLAIRGTSFQTRRRGTDQLNLTFFFRCGAKAKMRGIWSFPNSH